MCNCSHGCPVGEVSRDSFENRWPMRYRVGYNPDGTGVHAEGRRTERFAGEFYEHVCSPIFRAVDTYSRWVGGPALAWVGTVGVTVCKAGTHAAGIAFDLSRIEAHGWAVDCNTSWRGDRGLGSQRRYVALAATCRAHTGTVLTAWYNADHQNHIHFDRGVPFTVIRPAMRSDATLVQAAGNVFLSAGLALDGVWGPLTEGAYSTLRARLGLGSEDPQASAVHARNLLVHMAVKGFAGQGL